MVDQHPWMVARWFPHVSTIIELPNDEADEDDE